MKKILVSILALIVFGSMMALTGCTNITPPEGYKMYKENGISFAYPEDWTMTEGEVVMLVNPTGQGNNITVVSGRKTKEFDNMTEEKFNELFKPELENAGISVSNLTIENKETNNLDVLVITYTASAYGVSMTQTLFIVSKGMRTHQITITEATQDTELVKTVFETLNGSIL